MGCSWSRAMSESLDSPWQQTSLLPLGGYPHDLARGQC